MTQRTQHQAQPANGLTAESRDVLHALFCLSRDTRRISATTLAEAVALTPTETGAALVLLEQNGLVDASRARLTMRGLVVAMQVGSASGGPRKSGRNPQLRAIERRLAELPIAALPSQPPPALERPSREPAREQNREPEISSTTFEELRLEHY